LVLKQVQTAWDELDARRRVIALLAVVAVAAAVFGIGRLATAPSMALLYSGLDPAAAGEVVAALERQGIPFEVRDASIFVDGARRDQTRMALAAEGLPASGPTGYELLDGLSGFGTTSQMFDAAYWRAKEGELARTITATSHVRAARVHIANPSPQPFQRAATASASVTVTMARGSLEPGQAQAIRYLVSSAVSGLQPEQVSVIDSARGVVLASGERDPQAVDPAIAPEARADALKQRIERLLEARVGPGRAVVQVAVDADMEAQTIVERVIDPQSRIAISSELEQSRENQTGASPGVTVASNLPDGDVEGGAGRSSRDATQTRERTNFEVSETRRERVIKPGQVRRISVAVLVDGVTATDETGSTAWAPRPAEELEQLRELVQSTIGYDAERGDTVTIRSLEFTAPPEGTVAERMEESFVDRHGALLVQLGVLAAIVLALAWFVLRPMMQRRDEPDADALSFAPAPVEEPAPSIAMLPADPVLALPPQSGRKIDRLREVVASRGEDSSAILRNWIEAPEPRREIAG
jgi:flagellar M-ring protein FliF